MDTNTIAYTITLLRLVTKTSDGVLHSKLICEKELTWVFAISMFFLSVLVGYVFFAFVETQTLTFEVQKSIKHYHQSFVCFHQWARISSWGPMRLIR